MNHMTIQQQCDLTTFHKGLCVKTKLITQQVGANFDTLPGVKNGIFKDSLLSSGGGVYRRTIRLAFQFHTKSLNRILFTDKIWVSGIKNRQTNVHVVVGREWLHQRPTITVTCALWDSYQAVVTHPRVRCLYIMYESPGQF